MNEFARNIEEITGMLAKDVKEALAELKADALTGLAVDTTGKKLIEKDALLNFLNYRLSRNAKRYEDADNDEERRKIQYQIEELKIIIENVENM